MKTAEVKNSFGGTHFEVTMEKGDTQYVQLINPETGDQISVLWTASHGPRIDLLTQNAKDREFRVIPGFKDAVVAVGYSGQGHAYTFVEGKLTEVAEIVNKDDNIKNPLHRFVEETK